MQLAWKVVHKPTHAIAAAESAVSLGCSPPNTFLLPTRSALFGSQLSGDKSRIVATSATKATTTSTSNARPTKRRIRRRSQPDVSTAEAAAAAVVEQLQESDQVVELNVGGTLMSTFLSTLTLVPGSRLAKMFRTPDILQRDSQGRIFLDYDPQCFSLLLKWLRDRKLSQADTSTSALIGLTSEELHHFTHLVQHLQLGAPPTLPIPISAASAPTAQSEAHPHSPASSPGTMPPLSQSAPASQPAKPTRARRTSYTLKRPPVPLMNPPSPPTSLPILSSPPPCTPTAATSPTPSPSPPAPKLPTPDPSIAGSYQSPTSTPHPHPASSPATPKSPATHYPLVPATKRAPSRTPPSPPSSLYYIMAGKELRKGLRISVYTEKDLEAVKPGTKFDIFCDASFGDQGMSLSMVPTREFQNLFIGITSKAHTDQRGPRVPCYGWKQLGCKYSMGGDEGGAAGPAPLWKKGDCVEVTLAARQGVGLQLRVNGKVVDRLEGLPRMQDWCWYIALYTHGDLSSVVLHQDSYAVYWGDYQIRRYL